MKSNDVNQTEVFKTSLEPLLLFQRWKRPVQSLTLLLVCLIGVLSPNPLVALQARQQVTGQVIDAATKETIPGANIIVKGTTVGTVTDMDGRFMLEASGAETVLVVSFVGYLKQEITVGNQTQINIELHADQAQLEEIVVIGYGSQKKSDLTGAVTRVDAETFKNLPITNVSEML